MSNREMVNRERDIGDTGVRLCLDCGKCTVVCPVARYDPDFNPRLIAQRALGGNDSAVGIDAIWSCLSCYMCTERCNYHVKFPDFIHTLRNEALRGGTELHCSHGGALQSVMHMMAAADVRQDRLSWLPPDIELSPGCDTVFFVGCSPYFDILFTDLGVNTLDGVKGALRLLNRAKVPFQLLANERCCGRDLLLQGDRDGFLALARANMDEFRRSGIERVITACPEGYHTLGVEYPRFLGETGIEVLHLVQVLAPLLQSGALGLGRMEERVTYHDPCTLGRGSRVFDEPREILKAIAGLELVEMEQNREKALCCGASPWVWCGAVNRQIQKLRLSQAEATGAQVMVTACPKCQIHLKCAQKSGDGNEVKIMDLAAVAAGSLD